LQWVVFVLLPLRAYGQVPPGSPGSIVSYYLPTPLAPKLEMAVVTEKEENTTTTTPRVSTQPEVETTPENITMTTEVIPMPAEIETVEIEGSGSLAEDGEVLLPKTVVTENSATPEEVTEVLEFEVTTQVREHAFTTSKEVTDYKYNSCSDELKNMVSFLKVKIFLFQSVLAYFYFLI
jgi:hypothetical protein